MSPKKDQTIHDILADIMVSEDDGDYIIQAKRDLSCEEIGVSERFAEELIQLKKLHNQSDHD